MQFSDEVRRKPLRRVMVAELGWSSYARCQDMRLGTIVLNLLAQFGQDVRGLNVENLGEHFTIDDTDDCQIVVRVRPTSSLFTLAKDERTG